MEGTEVTGQGWTDMHLSREGHATRDTAWQEVGLLFWWGRRRWLVVGFAPGKESGRRDDRGCTVRKEFSRRVDQVHGRHYKVSDREGMNGGACRMRHGWGTSKLNVWERQGFRAESLVLFESWISCSPTDFLIPRFSPTPRTPSMLPSLAVPALTP